MNVLFFVSRATFGGVQFEAFNIIKEISIKFDVTIVFDKGGPMLEKFADIRGIQILVLEDNFKYGYSKFLFLIKLLYFKKWYKIVFLSVKFRFLTALLFKRSKTVYRHSGVIFNKYMNVIRYFIGYLVELVNILFSDSVVCVSEANMLKIKKFYPFKNNVLFSPTYYDVNRFLEANKDISRRFLLDNFKLDDSFKIVVCPLSFAPNKNQHLVYDILLDISDFNIALFFCGDGEYFSLFSNTLKSKDNLFVYFLGNVDNVEYFISGADILITASTYMEGLPQVISQSLYCQTPVFCWDWEGNKDEVFDGINGFLVKPLDIDNFRFKIVEYFKGSFQLDMQSKLHYDHGNLALQKLVSCIFNVY